MRENKLLVMTSHVSSFYYVTQELRGWRRSERRRTTSPARHASGWYPGVPVTGPKITSIFTGAGGARARWAGSKGDKTLVVKHISYTLNRNLRHDCLKIFLLNK